jgi:hypothetical protein
MEHQLGRCKLKSLLNSSCSGPFKCIPTFQHQFNMILNHRGEECLSLTCYIGSRQAGLLMVCIVNLQSARKFKPVKVTPKKESLNKLVCWRLWQILLSHNNLFTLNRCVQTSTLSKLYCLLPLVSEWVVNQCLKNR